VLKDPLFHFIVLGALLFGAWMVLNPADPADDPHTIVVDREALLTFIQYRTRSFDESAAAEKFDAWPQALVEDVIQDFVREEALYRSAVDMGLEADDYVVRQRMVQKVEFMAEGVADEVVMPADGELEAWYSERKQNYAQGSTITFAHVFFADERHGRAGALKEATKALEALNREQVPFVEAPSWGERFPYHVNYADRGFDEIVSHFGEPMATELFSLEPSESAWQGPFTSTRGSHLVLLIRSTPAREASFAEVRDQVLRDWLADATRARKDAFVQRVLDGFTVVRSPDLQR